MFFHYCGFTKEKALAVGDCVEVKPGVDVPQHGWAEVKRGDCGVITEIVGDDVRIDFPAQSFWQT